MLALIADAENAEALLFKLLRSENAGLALLKAGFQQELLELFREKKIKSLLVPYIFCATIIMLYESVSRIMHGNAYDILGTIRLYVVQNRYNSVQSDHLCYI